MMLSQEEIDRRIKVDVFIQRLQRRVQQLEDALKPFADADTTAVTHLNDQIPARFGTTLGDFRTAHDVIYPPSVK